MSASIPGVTPPRTEYVPSLDGLRTVAVGLVIAFHISVPGLAFGFSGVDVFFVLSGFLITTGLLRDTQRYGRPQFAKFWQRRFKRLLPAATLVLLLVLAYTTFFTPLFRKAAAADDVTWTAVYLGNWHFMGANSYFSSDGTPSLLLHMWSLAVEEQFYFVWPLLIGLVALALRGAARRASSNRLVTVLTVVTIVLILGSVVLLALLYDPASPDRSYMGTDTKAFEPLLGALLAILMSRAPVAAWFASNARWVAAVGLVASAAVMPFMAGPSAFYFRGGALILSVGVALLIGALASAPSMLLTRGFALPPLVYLGKISYGLYIWHWPWSVLLDVAHQEQFRTVRAPAAVLGTLVCAVLSYHFVEEPIRRGKLSKWLTGKRLLAAVIVVMAVTIGWAQALTHLSNPRGNTIVVVGDSVPFRLMVSLDEVGKEQGFVVDNASRGGCSPLAIEQQEYDKPDHSPDGDCRKVADLQVERIKADQPSIVFWWSRYEVNQRWLDGAVVGPDSDAFWEAQGRDLRAAVDRLTSTGATLVIAQTERPGGGMTTRCSPENCRTRRVPDAMERDDRGGRGDRSTSTDVRDGPRHVQRPRAKRACRHEPLR